ncbi:ubiquitin-protein ligase (E3) [Coemansia sp. RSA 2050]|nr:ubiquitin-protein ligase (E3) [Coemansia sp. RSA 2050]KAJ2731233.1 ubiquitin-protein ligase (E3) [Coemansia sp. BCRC 34962]
MFSFQGDFKRQRNINLGGTRRNDASRANAHAVLSKAHEDRERRELERRRQKAVTAIQRYWRGRRDAAIWRQQMRESLDLSVLNCRLVSLPDVYQVLAHFSSYYDPRSTDTGTMRSILQLLFMAKGDTATASSSQSVLSMVREGYSSTSDVEQDKWVVLVSHLLGQAIDTLDSGHASFRDSTDLVLESVACAAAAYDSKAWSFGWSVLYRMVMAKGLYAFLARCISGGDSKSSAGNASAALGLAMRPLAFGPMRDLATPCFARWILAIPGLPNKIDVHGVTALTRIDTEWAQLFACIRDDMLAKQQQQAFSSPSADGVGVSVAAINTIGNMAAFVSPRLSRSGPVTEFDSAFVAACAACASVIPGCDLFTAKRALVGNSKASRLVRAVDPQALKWLNNAISAQVLELLVRASCESTTSSQGGDMTAKSAEALLLTFIQRWGQTVGRAALDSIFQSVDIRAVRWHNVLRDKGFVGRFAGPRTKVEHIKMHDLSRFQLVCEVLNRQLQAIGDDELFEKGMSLSIDDIKVVARASRNIAFALYWAQEDSEDMVRIRDTTAALTRQLFIRNARHPFVDEEFWLIQPTLLDMSSFADKVAEDPVFAADTYDAAEEGGASSAGSDSESDSDVHVDDGSGGSAAPAALGARGSRFSWLTAAYSGLARSPLARIDRSITTPRVAVLRNIPFVVPFSDRVRLFHALVRRDRARLSGQSLDLFSAMSPAHGPPARARVRRGSIFEDGFRALFPVLSGRLVKAQETSDDGTPSPRELLSRPAFRAGQQARQIVDIDEFGQLVYDGDADEDDDDDEAEQGGRSRDPSYWGRLNMVYLGMPRGSADGRAVASLSSRIGMFKRRMQIQFVDAYGMVEAGIDGGGVFKEFLTSLVHEAFDPRAGLFNSTDNNHLYPNPEALHGDASSRLLTLDKFKFLGAVIGKALYEGVLVDAPFAQFFLGRFLGQLPGFNDLPTLDEGFYRGLVALKNYPLSEQTSSLAADEGNDEDDEIYQVFGMDFTVTVSTRDGKKSAVPLVPRGDTIKVTSRNRLLYLDLIAQFRLVKQIGEPVNSFLSGLHAIIPPVWLSLLFASPLELSRLLCGDSGTIDVANWKQNTNYDGAYRAKASEHPTIVAFWNVVENSLSERQRQDLCRFATSCERPPLLGFAELNPRFCITSSSSDQNGEHDHRLPSASTCVNLLKLPVYSSERVLCAKLVAAIESGAGFDLS